MIVARITQSIQASNCSSLHVLVLNINSVVFPVHPSLVFSRMTSLMSKLEQLELIAIYEARYRVIQIAYGTVALLIFDIFLTFKAELVYVWRRPWSLFKTLYLICRYSPLVMPCMIIVPEDSRNYCAVGVWYIFLGTTMLSIFPSDCLLALRLDRLYTSQRIRKALIVALTCEAIL